jgi:hypothetical protein
MPLSSVITGVEFVTQLLYCVIHPVEMTAKTGKAAHSMNLLAPVRHTEAFNEEVPSIAEFGLFDKRSEPVRPCCLDAASEQPRRRSLEPPTDKIGASLPSRTRKHAQKGTPRG